MRTQAHPYTRIRELAIELLELVDALPGAERDSAVPIVTAAEIFNDLRLDFRTPREIAERFCVTPGAVQKACRERKIGVRQGGRWMITAQEAERYFRKADRREDGRRTIR